MVLNRFFDKKVIICILIVFSLIPVFAQDTGGEPAAILVYADDEYEIEVIDADGVTMDAYIGMDLLEGDTIKTFNSTVELQLEPNGSILKLSEATNFRVDGFQRDINTSNDFSLIAGKIRAVAARSSSTTANYNIYTQSTVCGVRGTDFIIGDNGKLVVGEGSVEFIKMDTGESLLVNTGMAADAFSAAFEAIALTAEQLTEAFQSFQFIQLNPATVEGHTTQAPEELVEEETEEDVVEEEIVEEPADDGNDVVIEPVTDAADAAEDTEADGSVLPKEQSAFEKLLEPVKDFFGMEIGSLTIDGKTYSKVLLQPEFAIGDLQMALYLPVIYNNDVFNPDDWYHPAGNDEWSFGTDQDEPLDIAGDIVSDLFLKIKYVKWGEHRDPFYFKFGNVDDMTIGHGIIMENYANDADFPVVRKVGFNLGVNREKMGVELVSDDLSNIQIIGGRVAFGSKLKFGISSVVDINADINTPYVDDPDTVDVEVGDDMIPRYSDSQYINLAIDLDFPIFESDLLSFVLFTDAATMMPILDGQPEISFIFDNQIDSDNVMDKIRNYGFAGGILGNILGAQYKLQYMYSTDLFRHGLFNSTYDRTKTDYLVEVTDYMDSKEPVTDDNGTPSDDSDDTTSRSFDSGAYATPVINQGVYGALTWEIGKILDLSGGYKWPWSSEGMDFDNDYLHLSLTLKPDVIPVVGIHGSVSYDRTGFVGHIQHVVDDGVDFAFVDANTVLKGEVIVPLAPTLDMALTLASALERDDNGNVLYDDEGNTNAYFSFTFDTRISF